MYDFSWWPDFLLETVSHGAEEVVLEGKANSGWDIGSSGTTTGGGLFWGMEQLLFFHVFLS